MNFWICRLNESQYIISFLFFIQYILILYALWITGDKKITLALLFIVAFGLFLGGRFFAVILGIEDKCLWEGTFFTKEEFSFKEGISWFSLMSIFLCTFLFGYQIRLTRSTSSIKFLKPKYNDIDINNILNILFYLFALFVIWKGFYSIERVLRDGYLALYSQQENFHSVSLETIVYNIFLSFLGLALAYGNSLNKKRYFILFFLCQLCGIIAGKRGGFGGVLFLIIWLYGRNKKGNSILKCLMFLLLALVLLLGMSALSLRETYEYSITKSWQILLKFLFDQGVTFAVFGESMSVSYTWLHYFGALIPGAGVIIKFFRGTDIYTHEYFAPNHLANSLNPELYSSGFGLGWSILSDLYLCTFGNILLYALLSWIFGYSIGSLELRAQRSKFVYAFLCAISPCFFLWPRGTAALFTRSFFCFLFCFGVSLLFSRKSLQFRQTHNVSLIDNQKQEEKFYEKNCNPYK